MKNFVLAASLASMLVGLATPPAHADDYNARCGQFAEAMNNEVANATNTQTDYNVFSKTRMPDAPPDRAADIKYMRIVNDKERAYINAFKSLTEFMRGINIAKCYPDGMAKAWSDKIASNDAAISDLETDLADGIGALADLEAGK
jgi:hypothetical protein